MAALDTDETLALSAAEPAACNGLPAGDRERAAAPAADRVVRHIAAERR